MKEIQGGIVAAGLFMFALVFALAAVLVIGSGF